MNFSCADGESADGVFPSSSCPGCLRSSFGTSGFSADVEPPESASTHELKSSLLEHPAGVLKWFLSWLATYGHSVKTL